MSSSMLPSWQPCNEVAVSHKLSTVAQAPGNGSGSASSSANVVEQVPRPVARPLSSQPWSPSGLVFHSGDEDVLEPAESPVLGAGSRRRRLSVKRSAEVFPEAGAVFPLVVGDVRASEALAVELPVLVPEANAFDDQFATFSRQVHKKAWDAMRALWASETLQRNPVPDCQKTVPCAWSARRDEARESFQQLDDDGKSALAKRTADHLREKGADVDVVRCLEQKAFSMEQRVFIQDKQTVLLTYAGNWKEVANIHAPVALNASAEAVDAVSVCLRTHAGVVDLWQKFLRHVGEHSATLRLARWSASFELCPRTMAAGSIRVHAHLFLESAGKLRIRSPCSLAFAGCTPHLGQPSCVSCLGARGRALRTAAAAGHYYCRIPKVGSIFTTGTNEPFVDYPVKAEWITAYWQAEKLTDARAIEQYILCKRDVVRHIANVREQQRLRREIVVETDAAAVQARLRLAKKPRVHVPRVEHEFLEQFRDAALSRRKFLVLEGPSCVGKTEYARGLVQDAAQVYELNCANQREHVDLRGLVSGQHRMILFDEAEPELILCNKKLIQGQACMVQLGVSATARFGYSVFPWGIMMVVCSNTWSMRLRQLPGEDSNWLKDNSVHIIVDTPLWQTGAV